MDDALLPKFQRELVPAPCRWRCWLMVAADAPMYGYQIAKRLESLDGVLSGKAERAVSRCCATWGGGVACWLRQPSMLRSAAPLLPHHHRRPRRLGDWSAAWLPPAVVGTVEGEPA